MKTRNQMRSVLSVAAVAMATVILTAASANATITTSATTSGPANTAAASDDLLQTAAYDSETQSGLDEGTGGFAALRDGNVATNSGHPRVFAGNGGILTYFLDLTAGPVGYDITQIDVFTDWDDSGRGDQTYSVQVAPYDNLTSFSTIYSVSEEPGVSDPLRVTAVDLDDGLLAGGVGAVRFLFQDTGTQEAYREIDIVGAATAPPTPEPSTAILAALGLVGLVGTRRRRRNRS